MDALLFPDYWKNPVVKSGYYSLDVMYLLQFKEPQPFFYSLLSMISYLLYKILFYLSCTYSNIVSSLDPISYLAQLSLWTCGQVLISSVNIMCKKFFCVRSHLYSNMISIHIYQTPSLLFVVFLLTSSLLFHGRIESK